MRTKTRLLTLAATVACGATMIVGPAVGTAAAAPAVTGQATSVTSTSAQLNGTVYPGGLDTFWAFQYGTSTNYGLDTNPMGPLTGTASSSVSTLVNGLQPDTTYHFRLVAVQGAAGTSGEGTGYSGNDVTFTTPTTGSISTTSRNGTKHESSSLRSRTLHVRNRALEIPWSCTGTTGASCRTTMSLSARGKHGTVGCGHGTFSARTGHAGNARVGLTRKCLALVKAASHHRLSATLRASSGAGGASLTVGVTLVG